MAGKLVSVIIPVFNAEKYLRQCIESVLAQTYTPLELILVDDGSSDSSGEICDEYAMQDFRVRVIHQENKGVSQARNIAIADCRGEYVAFVDADDMIEPGFLERMMKLMVSGDFDMVCCDFSYEFPLRPGNSKLRIFDGVTFTEKLLYQNFSKCTNAPVAKLYRRECVSENMFAPGIRYEDLDSFYRFFPHYRRVGYVAEARYYYRQHPQSYMHRFDSQRAEALDVCDRMPGYFAPEGEFPSERLRRGARDRRLSAHFNILGLMAANGYEDVNLEARCRRVIREERLKSLFNPHVRLKNRLGILLSFFGFDAYKAIARRIY